MTSLVNLYLSDTGVTDAGLVHLAKLGKLRNLHLNRTKVTLAGVETLVQALPNCKFEFETPDP